MGRSVGGHKATFVEFCWLILTAVALERWEERRELLLVRLALGWWKHIKSALTRKVQPLATASGADRFTITHLLGPAYLGCDTSSSVHSIILLVRSSALPSGALGPAQSSLCLSIVPHTHSVTTLPFAHQPNLWGCCLPA